MMSPSDPKLGGMLAPRSDAEFHERRKTARFLLRGLRGTMSWRDEAGEFTCEVNVLNISGGGVAVLSERAPQVGQSLRLGLHGASARMEPVEAQLMDTSLDSSGQQVLHMRFARWVPLDSLLEKHRERRLWERYPARESRATLTWSDETGERTIHGDLLNISGGGAAFVSELQPPSGVLIRLQLEANVRRFDRIDPVESRLVTTSDDPSGMKIAHLQFVGPCPMDLFEMAVNGCE
jgi:hypothetical protein